MEEHLCEDCGLPIVRKSGKGPWPKRCVECKRSRHIAGRQARAEGREPAESERVSPKGPASLPQVQNAETAEQGRPNGGRGYFEYHAHPADASEHGPDDAQHDACRQAAHESATGQGLTVPGGWPVFRLLRVDTTGDCVTYVYGAGVRS